MDRKRQMENALNLGIDDGWLVEADAAAATLKRS
jgi:hypothetical protein